MTADFESKQIDLAREADFRLGDLLVRPSSRQVESAGKSETLQPRIMQVLVALARKRGQVVSRDELIEACWEGRAVGEDALNRCTQHIRKLGETSGAFRLETIPRVGYRMRADETPRETMSASGPVVADSAGARKPPPWLRFVVFGGAALLAIVLAGAIWTGVLNSKTVEVAPAPVLIAVLRFDAPPGDPELQQYADAVSQNLADALTQSGQRLIQPSLSMSLTAERKATAGKEFNAQLLVDGSVSREKDRARVVVRLDHVRRAVTVWSSTLEGAVIEPRVMAQRLSAQIMSKLSLSGVVNLLNSDDPLAVEQGITFLLILQRSDDGDDRGAMEGTKHLIEIAPHEVSSHYMRTIETMDALPILTLAERPAEFKAARDAAKQSRQLQEIRPQDSTGPWTAMARATAAYEWGARIDGFKQAIDTGLRVQPIGGLAETYLQVGRVREAGQIMPSGPISGKSGLAIRAKIRLASGDKTSAERDLKDGLDIWPKHPVFPEFYFESAAFWPEWNPEAAGGRLSDTGAWQPRDAQVRLLRAFLEARRSGKPGDIAEVEKQCDGAVARIDEPALLYCLSALTILKRIDRALDVARTLFPDIRPTGENPDDNWLKAPASSWDPSILFMPWMAPLRAHKDSVQVFDRLGLLDYWKDSGQQPDFCGTETAPVCAVLSAK